MTTTSEFDWIKLRVDSVKHITTLATGTIVLLVTFLDKFPKPLTSRYALIGSVIGMLLCVIFSFLYLFLISMMDYDPEHQHPRRRSAVNSLASLIQLVFVFALSELGFFAVANLMKLQ